MVSKFEKPLITYEFESHWVLHKSGFLAQLYKT